MPVSMDAAQDARSELHTFPRHRWKPSSADAEYWLPKPQPTTNAASHPLPAIETKSCQYDEEASHRFVSLKSQCDVSPSKSKSCRTNRYVHSTCSECFMIAPQPASGSGDHSGSEFAIGTSTMPSSIDEERSCCCSSRRASPKKRRFGCHWKWSFHNGATMVSMLVAAQFLVLMAALRSAVCGRSSTVNEVQRLVRSILPLMLLFNMLPLLLAG